MMPETPGCQNQVGLQQNTLRIHIIIIGQLVLFFVLFVKLNPSSRSSSFDGWQVVPRDTAQLDEHRKDDDDDEVGIYLD